MKKSQIGIAIFALLFAYCTQAISQSRGYYDAPYTRYEANVGTGGGTTITNYAQSNIAYEASERTCVYLANGQSREWTTTAAFRGIVVRGSGASSQTATSGTNVSADLYIDGIKVTTLTFDSSFGWKDLSDNRNGNYDNTTNRNPRMRYDEQRYLASASLAAGKTIKIVSQGNLYLDFIEIEDVPAAISCPSGYTQYDGTTNLQTWLNTHGGNVYIPAGTFSATGCVDIGTRIVQGAGMWYTKINWATTGTNNSGFVSYKNTNQMKDLSIENTASKDRYNNHKGLNGVWGTVSNVWVEHFECGAWIANYNSGYGDATCDGMTITNCRFRSNYADGVNLCKGSKNCTVSHCNFRSNGDDDMAVWPANNEQCYNNTFQYNTAEHCWFASSCALYGGYNNKWQYIIVRDNYEVGLRVNSKFSGSGFGDSDNTFSNIDVVRCGTWLGAYNNPFGAIDLTTTGAVAGNIKNVKFSCIDVKDALSEGLWLQGGSAQYTNVYFCGINVNGTGKEGLNNNNGNKASWLYGYPFRFSDSPSGSIYKQNLTITSRGGNATSDERDTNWGTGGTCTCAAISVTGVTLDYSTRTIAIGDNTQLTETVLPANANNKAVTWTSSDTGKATVSATGLVTGIAAGTSTITVKTTDGNFTATCLVTVQAVSVISVTIPTPVSIGIGGTYTFVPTFNPTNATNKNVTYSIVSGGAYITLNASTGLITGVAAGAAVVRVTTQDGAKTATSNITVTATPPCAGPNIIVKTAATPTIDGTIEALWNTTAKQWMDTQVINAGATTGYGASWRALYTATKLYMLIEIQKPTAVSNFYNTNYNDVNNWWNGSDVVQIFFSNGGIKEFRLIYSGNLDGSTPSLYIVGGITTGVVTGIKKGGTGILNIEVEIPWTSTTLAGTDNSTINMDVVTTLSNGTRLAQFTTYTPNEFAYNNVSGYGAVLLKDCPSGITTDIDETSNNEKSIITYDNIVKVSGLTAGEVVSVYNILGSKVYTLTATDDTEYISSLTEGVYTVSIDGTKIAEKVLIIK